MDGSSCSGGCQPIVEECYDDSEEIYIPGKVLGGPKCPRNYH